MQLGQGFRIGDAHALPLQPRVQRRQGDARLDGPVPHRYAGPVDRRDESDLAALPLGAGDIVAVDDQPAAETDPDEDEEEISVIDAEAVMNLAIGRRRGVVGQKHRPPGDRPQPFGRRVVAPGRIDPGRIFGSQETQFVGHHQTDAGDVFRGQSRVFQKAVEGPLDTPERLVRQQEILFPMDPSANGPGEIGQQHGQMVAVDVDAHRIGPIRIDRQFRRRLAAAATAPPAFDDQAVVEERAAHIGDGLGGQSGDLRQFRPRNGAMQAHGLQRHTHVVIARILEIGPR